VNARDVNAPRPATAADAGEIARLHAAAIHEGFLVTLGPAFLRRLYGRIARSSRAFALVVDAQERAALDGFVAVAEDVGAFYREFVLHDGVAAGAAALPRFVRAPLAVLETLWYGLRGDGGGGDGHDSAAEILALAVDPAARGRGCGRALADAAVAELRRRGHGRARVLTAVGNGAAIRTYERAGFRRGGTTDTVHRGVPQEVLVWP
jgi:ribosomal protein S18 acetylase RimI-like enzyme